METFKLILALALLHFTGIITSTYAQEGCAPKMVLIEMACAKQCGPCVDKVEELKVLHEENKDKMAWVYYAQAPIGLGTYQEFNEPYRGFHETFNVLYQSGTLVDRTFFPDNMGQEASDPSEMVDYIEPAFQQQLNSDYVPASIEIDHTFNPDTREVSVDLTADFCAAATGDLRFYLIVVQDTVVGPGEGYAQNCLGEYQAVEYGYPASSVMEFPSYPAGTIWIEGYKHTQVVKYQPSGFFGNAGVIASDASPGDSFTENYTFTLTEYGDSGSVVPVTPNSVEIIAAIVKHGSFGEREVLNANKVRLTDAQPTSTSGLVQDAHFRVIGNPVTSDILTLKWDNSSNDLDGGQVFLYDAMGRVVRTLESEINIQGNQSVEKSYTLEQLDSGIYFVAYRIGNMQLSRKVILR